MSGLFGSGAKQTVQTAAPIVPSPPTVANNQDTMDAAARAQALSLQRGRTATLLNGGRGLNDMGTTSKVLLGQ